MRPFLAIFLVSIGSATEALPGLLSEARARAAVKQGVRELRELEGTVRRQAMRLGYTSAEVDQALKPAMVHRGAFRQTLGDGTVIEFPWWRIGYAENRLANTDKSVSDRGETHKGGISQYFAATEHEVRALALTMDLKLAMIGAAIEGKSFRGAKGAIGAGRVVRPGRSYRTRVGDLVDPQSPALEQDLMMKAFADSFRAAGGDVGVGLDIQAGDIGTKGPAMKALSEAYGSARNPSPGVSGKAVRRRRNGSIDPRGGIAYRAISTGEGVWMAARLAARRIGLDPRSATVTSRGYGEVGRAFSAAAARGEAQVVGIQELWNVAGKRVEGTLLNPAGALATPRQTKTWLGDVSELRSSGGDLRAFLGERYRDLFHKGSALPSIRTDIAGLNASRGGLSGRTVPRYLDAGTDRAQRKIYVEGENLSETSAGSRLLDKNVDRALVVPGVLANIGGVHVSNLEAAQNHYGRAISDAQARQSLQSTMRSAWQRATKIADRMRISEREAIELAAVDAMMKRSLHRPDAPRANVERILFRSRVSRMVAARDASRSSGRSSPARGGKVRAR